jgi:hypothetical protein
LLRGTASLPDQSGAPPGRRSSPYRWIRPVGGCLTRLPPGIQQAARRTLTWAVRALTDFKAETLAGIPFDLVDCFVPSSRRSPADPAFRDYPTLFSAAREHGIDLLTHCAPRHDASLAAGLARLKGALRPQTRLLYWHIRDVESAVYRHGPDSPEVRSELRRLDAGLAELFNLALVLHPAVDLVVIGDHGMTEVRGAIDVAGALARAGLRQRQGFVGFLDSTIARFWITDPAIEPRLRQALDTLPGGRCLSSQDRDRLHLNHPDSLLGEILFAADPHMLILPNFFQRAPVRGMHGYAHDLPDLHSALVLLSPLVRTPRRIDAPVDMRCIYPTMLQLLGIERSGKGELESVL